MGAHSEGANTSASGDYSHAEGSQTKALGFGDHAEGFKTLADSRNTDIFDAGHFAHAEGYITTASAEHAHSEGFLTYAKGNGSHAEGYKTEARSGYSHAEGQNTIADGLYQHVSGKFNVTGSGALTVIGNGTNTGSARSNVAEFHQTRIEFTERLNIASGITASGDISSSGTVTAAILNAGSASIDSRIAVGPAIGNHSGSTFMGNFGNLDYQSVLTVSCSANSATHTALRVGGGKTVIEETLEVSAVTASFANLPTSDPGVAGRLFTQLGSQLGLGDITGSIAAKKFVFVSA